MSFEASLQAEQIRASKYTPAVRESFSQISKRLPKNRLFATQKLSGHASDMSIDDYVEGSKVTEMKRMFEKYDRERLQRIFSPEDTGSSKTLDRPLTNSFVSTQKIVKFKDEVY